ncbi:MAG: dTMP kinase [Acidobacteria bacterium]|nr:dTMP kinase [Acidobacteriota bacterium]
MPYPGKLITLEGLDGCGKSTQLELAARRLRSSGFRVTTTREPGGTAAGQQIRDLVLHSAAQLTPEAELALMFAARAQHVERVLLPALQAGQIVLCDRFTDSSFAYQGYGRGISLKQIRTLEEMFCRGVRPDLTLLLDLDPATGLERARSRNRSGQLATSRFEEEELAFFRRVREGYREIARREPERVQVLDASAGIAAVEQFVQQRVDAFLERVHFEAVS